jgi:hypothetical protein
MDEVDNLRGQSGITSSQGEQVRSGNSGANGKGEWWEFSGANYVCTYREGLRKSPFTILVNWLVDVSVASPTALTDIAKATP